MLARKVSHHHRLMAPGMGWLRLREDGGGGVQVSAEERSE
jgi:hypothetical protein